MCSEGQGASGQDISQYKPSSLEYCIEECDRNDDCIAFDYSYNIFSCRMYSRNSGVRNDPGTDLRIYCTRKKAGNNSVNL